MTADPALQVYCATNFPHLEVITAFLIKRRIKSFTDVLPIKCVEKQCSTKPPQFLNVAFNCTHTQN